MFPLTEWPKQTATLTPEMLKTIEASGIRLPSNVPMSLSAQQRFQPSPPMPEPKSKSSSNFLKRTQVPRACTNCRKMHAACGMERPCKRCSQNGLEESCQDVPRKKRSSKKKSKQQDSDDEDDFEDEIQPQTQHQIPQSIQQPNTPFIQTPIPSQSKMWEETYAELFGVAKENNFSSLLNSTYASGPRKERPQMGFQPDPLILTELDEEKKSHGPTYYSAPQPSMSATQVEAFIPKNQTWAPKQVQQVPQEMPIPKSTANSPNVSLLLQQIQELREMNTQLEKKLNFVSNELTDLKLKSPMRHGWITLTPQSELAISVWKSVTSSSQGTQNVLVECNERFVDILGYPVEVLRNNFPCSKMIRRKDLLPSDPDGGRLEWPKKTQIVTAKGMRDVFIIIYPVLDADSVIQYFVVHLMDVAAKS